MDDLRRILLLSTSTLFGGGYLDYAEGEICDFLGKIRRVLFVPFALNDRAAYATRARERFARLGYDVDSLHEAPDMQQTVRTAKAIFIGGGNTFRLLKSLYDFDLLPAIRALVQNGMPYIG